MTATDQIQQLTQNAIKSMAKGNSQQALSSYKQALEVAETSQDKQLILSCACNYGAACLVNNKAQEAIDNLSRAVSVANGIEKDDCKLYILLGDIQYNLGLAYGLIDKPERAIRSLKKAVQNFEDLNENRASAEAYQQLAESHLKREELEEGLEAYTKAAILFCKCNDFLSEGKVLMKQAKVLLAEKRRVACFGVAAKCEKICKRFLETRSHKNKPTKLLYDLAMVYKKLNQPSDCVRWLETAISDIRSDTPTEELKLQASIVHLLAKMSVELAEYTKATDLYMKAATLFGQLNNKKSRAWCFYHLGGVYLLLKDSHSAERNYHVAYQMLEDTGYEQHLWKVMEGLGDMNAVTYNFTSSITYYKEALTYISSRNTKNLSVNQNRLVEKLTSVLEAQKNGIPSDVHIVYKNRKPVILKMSDSDTTTEYGSFALPTLIASPNGVIQNTSGPMQSTPIIQEPKSNGHNKSRKKKKKNMGHRRQGELLGTPVPRGVDGYDTETDLSLIGHELQKQLDKAYKSQKSQSSTKSNHLSTSGDTGVFVQRSISDTSLQRQDSRNKKDEDDSPVSEKENKNGKKPWKLLGRKNKISSSAQSSSSSEESSSDSGSKGTDTYYNSGTQTALYATIDHSQETSVSGNFFYSTLETIQTNRDPNLSETQPSRIAPPPPQGPSQGPPTLPSFANHPSVIKHNKEHETSAHETSAGTSFDEEVSQPFPIDDLRSVSRVKRDEALYEVAVKERMGRSLTSPHHEYEQRQVERQRKKRTQGGKSRVCVIM